MNISKFTQKSVQAVQDLEKLLTNRQPGSRAGASSVCPVNAGRQPDPQIDRKDGDQ